MIDRPARRWSSEDGPMIEVSLSRGGRVHILIVERDKGVELQGVIDEFSIGTGLTTLCSFRPSDQGSPASRFS
jgi:hypothetical protein